MAIDDKHRAGSDDYCFGYVRGTLLVPIQCLEADAQSCSQVVSRLTGTMSNSGVSCVMLSAGASQLTCCAAASNIRFGGPCLASEVFENLENIDGQSRRIER